MAEVGQRLLSKAHATVLLCFVRYFVIGATDTGVFYEQTRENNSNSKSPCRMVKLYPYKGTAEQLQKVGGGPAELTWWARG